MMNRSILVGPRIWEDLDSYDKILKSKFIRTFRFISEDVGHPSLPTEVVHGGVDTFDCARVDPKYRIHFELRYGYYLILVIVPHPLLGIG